MKQIDRLLMRAGGGDAGYITYTARDGSEQRDPLLGLLVKIQSWQATGMAPDIAPESAEGVLMQLEAYQGEDDGGMLADCVALLQALKQGVDSWNMLAEESRGREAERYTWRLEIMRDTPCCIM